MTAAGKGRNQLLTEDNLRLQAENEKMKGDVAILRVEKAALQDTLDAKSAIIANMQDQIAMMKEYIHSLQSMHADTCDALSHFAEGHNTAEKERIRRETRDAFKTAEYARAYGMAPRKYDWRELRSNDQEKASN